MRGRASDELSVEARVAFRQVVRSDPLCEFAPATRPFSRRGDTRQMVNAPAWSRAGLVAGAILLVPAVTPIAANAAASGSSSTKTVSLTSLARLELRETVATRRLPGLGRVLTTGAGRTLYAYVPDGRGPSRCYRVCARLWPPLLLGKGRALESGIGVNRRLLSTRRRRNGVKQVTCGGRPLYFYALDARPGEAAGQGDDMGLWYAVRPNGTLDRRPLPNGAAS